MISDWVAPRPTQANFDNNSTLSIPDKLIGNPVYKTLSEQMEIEKLELATLETDHH